LRKLSRFRYFAFANCPTASVILRAPYTQDEHTPLQATCFDATGTPLTAAWKRGPWVGFNWRFDSGLVAWEVPCYGTNPGNDCPQSTMLNGIPGIEMTEVLGIPLTADQEFQAGFLIWLWALTTSSRATSTVECAGYSRQSDEQPRALQLSIDLQRYSLCHAENSRRPDRVSLLSCPGAAVKLSGLMWRGLCAEHSPKTEMPLDGEWHPAKIYDGPK
jgi:hypothetical protein